ncbi:MAG: rhodanese-like domain-containing protein [Gammaproteobacteria bacterium]|nr:rhodanese-like domain-containing protein [Gammaproteobacteria bacterium]
MKNLSSILLAIFLVLTILSTTSLAIDEPDGLDSINAYEMVLKSPSKTFILDVRTRAEYQFVGHPDLPNGAANIPLKFYPSWEINKDFIKNAEEHYKKDDIIITICRSGKRAKTAANLLLNAGFKNVFYMKDSFEGSKDAKGHRTVNGWKVNGLPYTYELKDNLLYK